MVWFGRHRDKPREETAQEDPGERTRILTGDDRIDTPKVRILLETIAELISRVDHREVLRSIVDNAIRIVGAERGVLFLFEDGDPRRPRIQVARDSRGRDLDGPIQFSTTVVRDVSSRGEARTWKISSSQGEGFDPSQSVVDMRLTSVMCTTLRVKDRRIGVIYVDSRASQREFSRADLRFFDALAGALAIAVENARLVREALATERMKEQIKIARRIQEGLLPEDPEGIEGFEIAGWSMPADEALGDYYDFIRLSDGRIVLAIGDVAGHGIGPAMLMSSARALLRALTDRPFSVEDVLARMNRRFEEDTGGSLFMSLFVSVLDPRSRTLVYGNAGHTPPRLCRRDGSVETLERTGMALGVDPDQAYRAAGPVRIEPGDRLVMITDGVLEARRGDEWFGGERLEATLRRVDGATARETIAAIHRAVVDFSGREKADDDLTVVVVRAT